jgi:hypothetical protein
MIKERSAKMDELGDTWEDAPVRTRFLPLGVFLSFKNWKNRTIC